MTKNKNSLLRKFPYPYKAGLSISSDPDFLEFDFFEEFSKFLNSNKFTKFGQGLGLEIPSGIFFYTTNKENFSYFDREHFEKKSKYADRLGEYLKSGWIDTNHAFGDFDNNGGFDRGYAQKVADTLDGLNIKIPVFTNHGDVFNKQNIGKNYPNYIGDLESSKEYHVDLLEKTGCEFVWSQDMVMENLEKFYGYNNVLIKNPLKFSSNIFGFNRLRGTKYHAPNLSSLSHQVSMINFEEMYKKHDALIIYQHFGVCFRYARHCIPATIEQIINAPYLLSGFYKLAQEYNSGNLWICGTGRLLKYLKMINNISIKEISYNTFEIFGSPELDLSGLTIYADTRDPVDMFFNGKSMPIKYNGIDETGNYSVTIPTKKLDCIW